jgi:hypothetical protein
MWERVPAAPVQVTVHSMKNSKSEKEGGETETAL